MHQHLWPEQFISALSRRDAPPRLQGSRVELVDGQYDVDLEAHRLERRIAVLDRDGDAAATVAAEVDGLAVQADVADGAAIDAAVTRVEAELGPLTDLVPNAGIGTAKGLWDYTDKEWALLVGVNLTGTFTCLRAVLPGMVERRRGSVVNVASLTGVRPTRGEGPYSAAKAGVIALTANAFEEDRDACIAAGMDGFLTKPLDRERLAAALATAADAKAMAA